MIAIHVTRPWAWTLAGIALAGIALAGTAGCGSSGGDGDDGGGGGTDPDAPSAGLQEVRGSFFLGDTDTPAAGYVLAWLDHTGAKVNQAPLDSQGAFTIPIEKFATDSTYSFHLLTPDYHVVADLDFSTSSGVQPGTQFSGGLGFDFGNVLIPLTSQGSIDFANAALAATLAGGFGLQTTATIESFPVPAGIDGLLLGADLAVHDPIVVLESFYNRTTHADRYARDLARWSRVRIVMDEDTAGTASRLSAVTGGDWLAAARSSARTGLLPQSTPWSLSGFAIPRANETQFEAHVFSGHAPATGMALIFAISSTDSGQHLVMRRVGQNVATIPVVAQLSLDGSAPATVNYSSALDRNGLSRPFCYPTADVQINLTPPNDHAGTALSATLMPYIDVEFDYYDANGNALAIIAADYSGGFEEAVADSVLTDITRSWTPTTQTLRFVLGTTAGAANPHALTIYQQAFLTTSAAGSVAKTRARVYYRGSLTATQVGTIIWFTTDC